MLLAMLIVVVVVFVREAALAVLPASIAILIITFLLGEEKLRRTALKSLVLVVIAWGILPVLVGRLPWQVRTTLDRSGMVFLPRIVMISASLDLSEPRKSQWDKLNNSFIAAGKKLSCSEQSMFESQLQEAVRYEIGPKLLLDTVDTAQLQGTTIDKIAIKAIDDQAFRLFKQAVRQDPGAYLVSTSCHFWGLVTAGTHIDTTSRQLVYRSLQLVDPETWALAKFRTDYPLNRFDIPLKVHTQWIYGAFRLLTAIATLVGIVVSLQSLFLAIFRSRRLNIQSLVWMLPTGWLVAHSLLIALSVYPDPRYVMANFIIQWTLLALAFDSLAPIVTGIVERRLTPYFTHNRFTTVSTPRKITSDIRWVS
jgi:hypothetical protein